MKRIPGALILTRYSTDQQNEDTTEVQIEKCAQWCRQHDIPVLDIFSDQATSGMKDTRKEYNRMLKQLRQGIGDTVVIYDQSRMFRKMTSWFTFREELEQMGVCVISATQPMVGKDLRDPANFLHEGSTALFNQLWVLQTRQKVMEKMRFMARNGLHTGGKPALGYKIQEGRLVIDEDEARIVRRIFTEYAEGRSYKSIIDGLNADGLKTKRGNAFGSNSLHDLLHNEKYIGVLVYGGKPYRENGTRNTHAGASTNAIRIEDALPAIISKELFETVQKRMAKNKREQGGRPATRREYPLRGKVFCGDCKSAMTISTSQQKYNYYRCTGKKRLHTCEAAPISADRLEQIVAETLRSVLGTPSQTENLIRILREQAEKIQGGAVTRLRSLIDQEADISKKLDNAVDALLNGFSSQIVKDRITDLETQKERITREIRALKKAVDASAIPERRLREILDTIIHSETEEAESLFTIVYRVEVTAEFVTIWTILDADPDGNIDLSEEGVIITPGFASGVPKKNNPNLISVGEGFGLFMFLGGQHG